MDIPFFNSKSRKLKKLLEEGKLREAQKLIENNTSLLNSLINYIHSNNSNVVSNAIYIATKIFLKYNQNIELLFPYIKECLKSDNENLVLNTLISLKIMLNSNPKYYNRVEEELLNINEKFTNMEIRNYTWELIKKYGKLLKSENETSQVYIRIKKLINSTRQESLIKKLFNKGACMLNLNKIEKLDIAKEFNSSIKRDDLKGNLELIKNNNIEKLAPLNIAYCLSTVSTLNEEELEEVIGNILKLLFNENDIVRNIALNAIYEISKHHPSIIYKNICILKRYGSIYGESIVFNLILKEISKKYNLKEKKC
ncbi:hypothetical protein [Methanothermococcus sp.]|uniref:hypothetical protein n=1 Tax=Methanothermococcus sp. TaxID=2614238 RepID=UPI0025D12D83|nr:hypothetical protein [Methanothermococcus sp.]